MNRASGLVVAALLLNAGCEVSRDGSPSNAQTMPSDHSGRPSTSSPESRRDPAPDRYASAEDAITDETAPAPILQLTEETFEQQVLMSDRPVLVEFCAPWCGPCRRFEPTIDALAREYDGRVIVAKIDFDMNRQLAERYNIRRTPTVLILRQGRVVEEVDNKRLSRKMVLQTFTWARRQSDEMPFVYFQFALRAQAKKIGVNF